MKVFKNKTNFIIKILVCFKKYKTSYYNISCIKSSYVFSLKLTTYYKKLDFIFFTMYLFILIMLEFLRFNVLLFVLKNYFLIFLKKNIK